MHVLLPLIMGFAFGILLNRSKVTDSNVIEGQFCLCDFTMLKVMLPAIVIGGLGVLVLIHFGDAKYHIKDANILGVALGATMFGLALVFLGYCPGTSLAATATGSVHALVGVLGMLAGAMLYAFSFSWIKTHILNVWAVGKVRLPELTGVPDIIWLAGLGAIAVAGFVWLERRAA
ncbi:YeeE/YedE family protein [Rhodoblastus acidophilus]|uniref:YeeE/YedE family protein n=1 Tax=Candidatus Rhodoblastus alkanivorans TaxID=2954117 RepID=A0ABS9Z9K2_9HYPH|nr:YeeE/YedE thiosulfate transporter family protein [Candidatus Rhodoblastus alkanivorans]MCI4680700.1 YeeE/YedE family protein [Candidatus Rhodoblastus alkanivorans]MCI4684030.1 YeeE/YedE family protein [Candidatus Rhodoblastus alkanivorans]MDI4641349.1 YeeE/YedE family protein [Rhodoblastus acidophilus]